MPCIDRYVDCRTPGAGQKEVYALIGNGVSQNAGQFIIWVESVDRVV